MQDRAETYGPAVMVKVSGCDVAVCFLASFTVTVKLNVPVFVGKVPNQELTRLLAVIALSIPFERFLLATPRMSNSTDHFFTVVIPSLTRDRCRSPGSCRRDVLKNNSSSEEPLSFAARYNCGCFQQLVREQRTEPSNAKMTFGRDFFTFTD